MIASFQAQSIVCAQSLNTLEFCLVSIEHFLRIKGKASKAKSDMNRRLAQLVRALGRHPRGHQFESGTAYQIFKKATSIK